MQLLLLLLEKLDWLWSRPVRGGAGSCSIFCLLMMSKVCRILVFTFLPIQATFSLTLMSVKWNMPGLAPLIYVAMLVVGLEGTFRALVNKLPSINLQN